MTQFVARLAGTGRGDIEVSVLFDPERVATDASPPAGPSGVGAERVTAWISERRFAPFLQRARGDRALATELYLWHAQVAGASLTTLHHFEVALRNAIDRQLGAGRGYVLDDI